MTIRKRENGNFGFTPLEISRSVRNKSLTGFTLIEILVTCSIIIVLAGLATLVLSKVKTSAKSVVCLSNLKQIAAAIQMYHSDYKVTPKELYPLLSKAGYTTTDNIFKCPVDLTGEPYSYEPFYLPRMLTDAVLTDSQKLFLGCPRHGDKSIALFGWPQFNIARTCKILWNGAPVTPGTIVRGGELLFEDGTKVVINGNLPVGVMLSTVDQNKQIYSTINIGEGVLANGDITVTHPNGFPSQFEVLTPSLITGVAGTAFNVSVTWPDSLDPKLCKTSILCTQGKVLVEELYTEKIYIIEAGGSKIIKSPIQTISPTTNPTHGHSHWWWKWWKS